MPLITIPRGDLKAPVLLLGLPAGRLLFWTVIFAIIHRGIAVGLWISGFGAAMASFTRSDTVATSKFCFTFSAMLDFPIVFLRWQELVRSLGSYPRPHPADVWTRGGLGPYPHLDSIAWSLLLGVLVAALFIRLFPKRIDSHGPAQSA